NRTKSGLMKHDICALHCSVDNLWVANITFNKLDIPERGEIRFMTRTEIVQNPHAMPITNQPLNNMTSDKTRTAGHKIGFAHDWYLFFILRVLTKPRGDLIAAT